MSRKLKQNSILKLRSGTDEKEFIIETLRGAGGS